MPIYTFTCTTCKKEADKLVSFSNADEPQQCDCSEDAVMVRDADKIHETSFALKGSKWFKNSGTY